jgi:uncharacterized membrane protein
MIIPVCEESDGQTYIGTMNAGLLDEMFGGTVAEVISKLPLINKVLLSLQTKLRQLLDDQNRENEVIVIYFLHLEK